MRPEAGPAFASARPEIRRPPSWPFAVIVLLVAIAEIAPVAILTAINGYLLLMGLLVWASSDSPLPPSYARMVLPFLGITLCGLVMGIGADRYVYLKDVWYLANIVAAVSSGYILFLASPDLGRGLRAMVMGGTLLALVYLSRVIEDPRILSLSAVEIRDRIGFGFMAPVISLSILAAYRGQWSIQLRIPRPLAWACLFLCGMAILVSFSRTSLILLIIGLLAAAGAFLRREWLHTLVIAAVVVGGLSFMNLALEDTASGTSQRHFVVKLARSFEELHVQEYASDRSINQNYRGFETARALKHFAQGNVFQWLFGSGFGAQVDLGVALPLGGASGKDHTILMRTIPIFHNGYIYVLTKAGIAGLMLYGGWLLWVYLTGRRQGSAAASDTLYRAARLLQAVALSLAVATWVVMGLFSKTALFPYPFVAGYLLAALGAREGSSPSAAGSPAATPAR